MQKPYNRPAQLKKLVSARPREIADTSFGGLDAMRRIVQKALKSEHGRGPRLIQQGELEAYTGDNQRWIALQKAFGGAVVVSQPGKLAHDTYDQSRWMALQEAFRQELAMIKAALEAEPQQIAA